MTRNSLTAVLFLLPNFVIFFFLGFIPLFGALGISLTDWNGIKAPSFVALDNYSLLLKDSTFWKITFNTFYWSFGSVAGTVALGLFLALILNRKVIGASFFRAAFYFPHISSFVAIAVVWGMIFHPTYGPLTMSLKSLGVLKPPLWLSDNQWAMLCLLFVVVWKNAGHAMVIFLAGLTNISKDVYEAAAIDGASKWQQFWKITLPLLSPITFFIVVTSLINSFKGFDLIYVMTKGGPGNATTTMAYDIYEKAFKFSQFGLASAMSFILLGIILIITWFQFKWQRKWVND
jgi:multiple sugar transport system permease protein